MNVSSIIVKLVFLNLRISSVVPDRLQDANETLLPYPAEPIRFKTFPDPRLAVGSHFRFLATSCATPNFPYAPLQGRRIKGYDLLADYLWPKPKSVAAPLIVANASVNDTSLNETASSTTSSLAPSAPSVEETIPTEFMLFLGDFIYADVPMYFGDDKESYRRLYRRNYQSPSYRKVYERLRKSLLPECQLVLCLLAGPRV